MGETERRIKRCRTLLDRLEKIMEKLAGADDEVTNTVNADLASISTDLEEAIQHAKE